MDLNESFSKFTTQLKDRLKLGPKDVIGLDIGQSAVKMAELKKAKDGSYKLVNFIAIPLSEGCIIEDEIQKEDEIVEAITEGIKRLKTSREVVSFGLSGPNTVARKLQLAGGSLEEIEDQVSWESEQYLPFPIEDSTVSFHVFGENEGGGVDVLVAAAKNDVIQNFKGLIEKTKLRLKIIDLNLIAVTNVFEHVMEEKIEESEDATWILLDLGAQRSQFVIFRNGAIVFSKEMEIGGSMITEEIQRQMGVNYQEAEDLKTHGDDKGNLPEEIMEIINDINERFYQELKKTIDFYITSTSDESFKECVITGGGGLVPGIIEGLEGLLGITVSILNPFEKIDYDRKKFSEDEINKIAFIGTVAIGLAMRDVKK